MNLLETRILINLVVLVFVGVLLSVAFTYGAIAYEQWGFLIAPPMCIAGLAVLIKGASIRRRTQGSSGVAFSTLGAVLIVGSIWAAFILNNALQ